MSGTAGATICSRVVRNCNLDNAVKPSAKVFSEETMQHTVERAYVIRRTGGWQSCVRGSHGLK